MAPQVMMCRWPRAEDFFVVFMFWKMAFFFGDLLFGVLNESMYSDLTFLVVKPQDQ